MRWHVERIWGRLLLLLICPMMAACIFSGCKTTRYVPLERTVYRESVRCDTLQWRDSIHIQDSVYISQRGDTVYRDRWHRETVLKKIYQTKVDSFVKRDSIPVPYPAERELSGWEQFRLRYAVWAMGLLCVVLLWQGYKLYKWIRNGKYQYFNKEG